MISYEDEWDEFLHELLSDEGEVVREFRCDEGSIMVVRFRDCYYKFDPDGDCGLWAGPELSADDFGLDDFSMVNETTEAILDVYRAADEVAESLEACWGPDGHRLKINGESFKIDEENEKVVRVGRPPKITKTPRSPERRSTPPLENDPLWDLIVEEGEPVCRKRFVGEGGEWQVYRWRKRYWCRLCGGVPESGDSRYICDTVDEARECVEFHEIDDDIEAVWDAKWSASEIINRAAVKGKSGQGVEINGEAWVITEASRLKPVVVAFKRFGTET